MDLYKQLAPAAYAIALRVLDDAGEAEDVLQVTFVTIWREAARYDATRLSFDKWLAILIRNRALDRLRQKRSHERMLSAASLEPLPRRLAVDEGATGRRPGAICARRTSPVRSAKRWSSPITESSSQSEIAHSTATPRGTVKARMRLAMIKLADVLPRSSAASD